MVAQTLKLGDREYVVLERAAYDRLLGRHQRRPATAPTSGLALPRPDPRGLRPAAQTLRAILGRDIVRDRVAAGLSQRELAHRAGIRPETLSRIESGRHTPTVASIEKIDRVLRSASDQTA